MRNVKIDEKLMNYFRHYPRTKLPQWEYTWQPISFKLKTFINVFLIPSNFDSFLSLLAFLAVKNNKIKPFLNSPNFSHILKKPNKEAQFWQRAHHSETFWILVAFSPQLRNFKRSRRLTTVRWNQFLTPHCTQLWGWSWIMINELKLMTFS